MPAEVTDDPENVLFVFTDQQRLDSIGAYGNDWVDTPNLDRLAEEGVRFDNAYTPAAICSPARAAVVTGMRPHKNGIERNVSSDTSIAQEFPCYPQLLRDAGYNIGIDGKWHLGQHPGEFGMDGEHLPGYFYSVEHSDYLSYLDERDLPRPSVERLEDAFPNDGNVYQSGAADTRPADASFTRYITERAVDRLEEYLEETPQTPFYQSVHYFGPHNPYYLPEEYYYMYDPADIDLPESAIKETFKNKPWTHTVQSQMAGLQDLPIEDWRRFIAVYHGWVTFIDDQVGLLLNTLEDHGVADDTAVVFSSDHGAFLTAHKMHDKGPAMYEDIYNVPLIATGLGESGHVEDRFVSLLDLAPTFLDIAGIDSPAEYDGRSLCELYAETADWRDYITAEFHGHFFAYEQRMIRRGSHKLVLNEFDTAEFYDLSIDPNELNNRIDDPEYGSAVEELYRELVDHLENDGDSFVEGPTRKLSMTSSADFGEYGRHQ